MYKWRLEGTRGLLPLRNRVRPLGWKPAPLINHCARNCFWLFLYRFLLRARWLPDRFLPRHEGKWVGDRQQMPFCSKPGLRTPLVFILKEAFWHQLQVNKFFSLQLLCCTHLRCCWATTVMTVRPLGGGCQLPKQSIDFCWLLMSRWNCNFAWRNWADSGNWKCYSGRWKFPS